MTTSPLGPASWRRRAHALLQSGAAELDELVDAARRRTYARYGWGRAQHIAAFRSICYGDHCELRGRVLASKALPMPDDDDNWWDNLLDTYRRFESDEVAGVALRVQFRGRIAETVTDDEGYYTAHVPVDDGDWPDLWADAMVSLADGTLATLQPVMTVPKHSRIGVISDIDDTVLTSGVVNWKLAAQLAFLHNARTRKPLAGVAALYQALQQGNGTDLRPLFYVSSSPWNLYDLLEDFLDLNAIPPGPLALRDLGFDADKLFKSAGHHHKLERAVQIMRAFPDLSWILIGDSGQDDAELYAEAVRQQPGRVLAVYVRDVDPGVDSARDRRVDRFLEAASGQNVPLLRVQDSSDIARHAAEHGWIPPQRIERVEAEVERDVARPDPAEAAIRMAVR